jgi:hypothetical protein
MPDDMEKIVLKKKKAEKKPEAMDLVCRKNLRT